MTMVFCGSGLMPLSEMRNPAKEISVPMTNFIREIMTFMGTLFNTMTSLGNEVQSTKAFSANVSMNK